MLCVGRELYVLRPVNVVGVDDSLRVAGDRLRVRLDCLNGAKSGQFRVRKGCFLPWQIFGPVFCGFSRQNTHF